MKLTTSTALALALAGVIGVGALTPAAFAQQAPRQDQQQFGNGEPHRFGEQRRGRGDQFRMRMARQDGRGTLLDLVCSDDGAERMEIGFVRLAHRVDLTADQAALLDDLKSTALTAQTTFADQCAAAPQPGAAEATAAERPDPVERLTARIANDTLKTGLLESILPRLEAFYGSLTDAQKAALEPQPGEHRRGQRQGDAKVPALPETGAPAADDLPA